MNHASAKVSEVARKKLSLMGASGKANPLLRKLQEGRGDLLATSREPLPV
jgi:hypothetical protein